MSTKSRTAAATATTSRSTKVAKTATRKSGSVATIKSARKPTAPVEPKPAGSKQSQLIALLRSPTGGTIQQLTDLTGWQSHTVRGTISGALRKRMGLNVVCAAEGDARVYRIVEAA